MKVKPERSNHSVRGRRRRVTRRAESEREQERQRPPETVRTLRAGGRRHLQDYETPRAEMWSPGVSSLFLVLMLGLTPRPGVSQGASLFKSCPECKKILTEEYVSPAFYKNLVTNASYTDCANNIIRFQLPRRIFCGSKMESWVNNVTKCIKQGRAACLQPSVNQKDFSKGSNEKSPTTTIQESTTSAAKTSPSLRPSTQTWKGGTPKPSAAATEETGTQQKILETTIGLTITSPDSAQNNNGLLQAGNEPSTDKYDEKNKMKQMTIAVVSLILIVLVMAAVGVYVWCRKVRITKCRRPCEEEAVMYQPAPLEE